MPINKKSTTVNHVLGKVTHHPSPSEYADIIEGIVEHMQDTLKYLPFRRPSDPKFDGPSVDFAAGELLRAAGRTPLLRIITLVARNNRDVYHTLYLTRGGKWLCTISIKDSFHSWKWFSYEDMTNMFAMAIDEKAPIHLIRRLSGLTRGTVSELEDRKNKLQENIAFINSSLAQLPELQH